jgi:hypothetical protein
MVPERRACPRGRCSRGLTIGCRGCGALHAFSWRTALRAGPAPLTLASLGACRFKLCFFGTERAFRQTLATCGRSYNLSRPVEWRECPDDPLYRRLRASAVDGRRTCSSVVAQISGRCGGRYGQPAIITAARLHRRWASIAAAAGGSPAVPLRPRCVPARIPDLHCPSRTGDQIKCRKMKSTPRALPVAGTIISPTRLSGLRASYSLEHSRNLPDSSSPMKCCLARLTIGS